MKATNENEAPNRMDKRLKRKWLKALRSGQYKQGKGALVNEAGAYCCIGVLGKVCGMPDEALLEHAGSISGTGLEALDYARLEHSVRDRLADMNDGVGRGTKRKSFKQIANWIEKNL